MTNLSRRARKERNNAIQYAAFNETSDDLDDDRKSELAHALDELLPSTRHDEVLDHLAEAAASAYYAEDAVVDHRRAEDRDRGDALDAEGAVSTLELHASEALKKYACEAAREHLDDAVEYLDEDVTLTDVLATDEEGETV